ncbi:hypothetical protein O1W68_03165 [Rhodococcus sp. H36-A4]|uniref:hypothetical protein n=1 Tax=Rhodococcus sp. H36-A4 TaxID=3004353 RepID=UPI0022AF1516|nr:hypothetical protein [Rhodococcus sp. H36-A4]MCZ4076933.1 hypothetical protein [Rhodococcus sp. H36-A4]
MNASQVPGAVVADRYRLLQRRPSIGWGARWRAKDLTSGRDFSLSLFRIATIQSHDPRPDALGRFIENARAHGRGKQGQFDVLETTPYVAVIEELGSRSPFAPPTEAPPDADAVGPRRKLTWVLAAGAAVGAFGLLGWLLSTTILGNNLGDVSNVAAAPDLPSAMPIKPPPAPILPAGAEVWSAVRSPDNPGDAQLAIDANPATAWSTDNYRSPFGTTNNGIGLLVNFAYQVDFDAVWISTPVAGTTVEIRTPPEPNATLSSTRVLGSAVSGRGVTTIPTEVVPGSRAVLVWVAELAPDTSGFASEISEIGFTPA